MVSIFDKKIKEYGENLRKEREEKRLEKMFNTILNENFKINDLQKKVLNIEDKRYIFTTKGKRIGLSTAASLKALKAAFYNKKVLIVSQYNSTARLSEILLTDLIKPEILRNEFILRNNSLIWRNKSVIDFSSACSEISSIRGHSYDLIIIDELSYLKKDKKERLLKKLEQYIDHKDGQLIAFNRIGVL